MGRMARLSLLSGAVRFDDEEYESLTWCY